MIQKAISVVGLVCAVGLMPSFQARAFAAEGAQAVPVVGTVDLVNQCANGQVGPVTASLELWGEKGTGSAPKLKGALPAIQIQVDCKRRTISVKQPNLSLESAWEILPDGSFSVSWNGAPIEFAFDSRGNANCQATPSYYLSGNNICGGEEGAKKSRMELVGSLEKPDGPGLAACGFESGAYLYGSFRSQKCQSAQPGLGSRVNL